MNGSRRVPSRGGPLTIAELTSRAGGAFPVLQVKLAAVEIVSERVGMSRDGESNLPRRSAGRRAGESVGIAAGNALVLGCIEICLARASRDT